MMHDRSQPTPSRKRTILVVDDQPEHIDVVKAALEKHFTVIIATRAMLGLRLAKQGEVDLILLDVMMPGMDGFELCRLLKADPVTREIPVVFLTAKHNFDDEKLGLSLGAMDFIRKPSSPAIVLARVSNLVALYHAQRALISQNETLVNALQMREDIDRISRHDLKGPLVGIIGLPELLLEDDNLTEEQKQLIKVIETNGYTMLEMINRSLDLLKMENGTYQLQAESFDLLVLIKKVIIDLDRHIVPKNIQVTVASSDPAFMVRGERLLCYSLFHNLIMNAVQASPTAGEITITLSAQHGLRTITLTNSGEVPHEIRSRFFEKYVTYGKQEGTGLGTYSAWLAAKAHGGSIRLESSRPGFTSIVVTLPSGDSPA